MPNPICTFPGCGRKVNARGLCVGHYTQVRNGLPLTRILRGQAARFWAKVEKTETCWNWTATKSAKGYGHFKAEPGTTTPTKAHRWSYEDAYGPISEGLTIDHLCRNTSCVRPDHLEAVDGKTNTLRGDNPCAVNARKTHCKRGHDLSPGNYYQYASGSRICKACHREREARRRSAKVLSTVGSR